MLVGPSRDCRSGLPATHGFYVSINRRPRISHTPKQNCGTEVLQTHHLSTQGAELGESGVQPQPGLHSGFKVYLCNMNSCLKTRKMETLV